MGAVLVGGAAGDDRDGAVAEREGGVTGDEGGLHDIGAEGEGLDREILVGIGPHPGRHPAHAAGQRAQRFDAVFVGILGVDGLTGAEIETFAGHFHLLPLEAGEVHFDAVALTVVEGVMLEGFEVEGAAQFAIDAGQQIEIEFGGDAGLVVVGGVENIG